MGMSRDAMPNRLNWIVGETSLLIESVFSCYYTRQITGILSGIPKFSVLAKILR